ncbi:tetratricopeptide repeat protein [Pedobacter sp. MR2016-24]|uniref:tetratricopeptide repeat protein n=1 Tax=Pedobacter sp. MR2016-24 TaxID=2994466 RepID=UPI0022458728|nr:tetratricopeptide repeat protein [Pedobacter sp. MR2016-24]MCX2482282.1 tetratricopeptide repeat protein [Pedobacter sp. MR2016-24]
MKALITILFLCVPFFLAAQYNEENEVAMQYYQDGEFEKAAVVMEKLYSRTRNEAYFDLYFNALLKSRRFDEAEKVTSKLVRQQPDDLRYLAALGKTKKEKGELENARKTFSQLVNLLPEEESKVREIANYLYQMGEYDTALDVFTQGRKIFKNEQMFTFELLSLYRYKKDKNMLIEEYLNALSTMPQMLQQAETVFSSIFEGNSDYLMLQNALFKKIQREPQNESYAKLLTWQYLQQEEYEMALRQLIAQDKRIKDNGAILFENAQTFMANKAYETAIKAYTYLLTKGQENEYFLPAKLAMIDARYQLLLLGGSKKEDIIILADQFQTILTEYGQNARTLFAIRKLANIQAYYLHDLDKAEGSLEAALKFPGISNVEIGEMKLELGDIYVLNQEPWEAILMYEQVAKEFENQNIGNEAKYRSARLSFYQGNFTYAKSQADVLKASTAQLIANDAMNLSLLLSDHLETGTDTLALKMFASAELLQFKNLSLPALARLDSITIKYPQNTLADDILMTRSRIYIRNGEFDKAAVLLNQLIAHPQKNIWTDDALFMLAGLNEVQLNNPEQAKILYQRLITDFPGSMYVAEARKHFRKLRGDNMGS